MPATTDSVITVTPEALQTMSDMSIRVEKVGQLHGYNSEEYRELLRSYSSALITVFRLGGRISKDGELGLFGASFIAYGVVWHPKNRADPECLLGEWGVHS